MHILCFLKYEKEYTKILTAALLTAAILKAFALNSFNSRFTLALAMGRIKPLLQVITPLLQDCMIRVE